MIDVDGVRLRDLSVGGWLGIGIVGIGLYLPIYGLTSTGVDFHTHAVAGVVVALLGAYFALDNARAEVETTCDACGTEVRVHSGRDAVDEAVLVQASGRPRRASIGPIDLVVGRQTEERVYCSGECADGSVRTFLETPDPAPSSTAEGLAADGGSER